MPTQTAVKSYAVESIREDHRKVLDLFALFQAENDEQLQKEIAQRCISELEVHTFIEETVLYPFCAKKLGIRDFVAEARRAHGEAKRLISELKRLPAGKQFRSVFARLRHEVTEHIEEEEENLLVPLEDSDLDQRVLAAELGVARAAGMVKPSGRSLSMILLGVVGAAAAYYYFSGREKA